MLSSRKWLVFSSIVLALGMVLTLIRSGAIFSSKLKTSEQYWSATGLNAGEIEKLLQDQKCASSERYFLACVNAISVMANRYNLALGFDAELSSAAKKTNSQALSERSLLDPWKSFYAANPKKAADISFIGVWKKLNSQFIGDEQKEMIIGLGINGFISVYQDPHTYLIPVDQFNEVVSRADNRSISLGLILGFHEGKHVVKKVVEGSPAKLAGIRRGDFLLAVNGVAVRGLNQVRVIELLKGTVDDSTALLLRRNNQKIAMVLKRAEITVATVSTRVIEGVKRLGVIGINKFAKGACDKVKQSLQMLNKAQVRGLLLDLRDNPGGQLEEASCVASLFLGPDEKIFEIRYFDKSKNPESYFGEEEKLFNGPMAVLINSSSASSAEIVAGALQDLHRAILVGEKSFGKGSFQEGDFWETNKKLALFQTKGFFYLPSGRSPQLVGLTPDVAVKFDELSLGGEMEEYMNPLKAPAVGEVSYTSSVSINGCLEIEDESTEDVQILKAKQVLFCAQTAERPNL